MKRYKLLKNLPFAKAGTIFRRISFKSKDGLSDYDYLETNILLDGNQDETVFSIKRNYFINNFDEWFEEVKELEQIYYVDNLGGYVSKIEKNQFAIFPALIANLKSIGNYFESEEEAKKYLEYLKAKTIIKEDSKGVHFYWKDVSRVKYYGVWNCQPDILNRHLGLEYRETITDRASTIFFNSKKDIKESFEKHPEEWKTYLTYEQ